MRRGNSKWFWGGWGGGRCHRAQGIYVCNKTSLIASRDMSHYGEDCYLLSTSVCQQQAGKLRLCLMEQFLGWSLHYWGSRKSAQWLENYYYSCGKP